MSALASAWELMGHLLAVLALADDPRRAVMLTAAVLAVALIGCLATTAWCGRDAAALPVTRRVAALREKSWHVAFLRLRDPDAPGRTRARAPSAAPAAA